MTDIRIIDQIAVISARLKRLGGRYKAARNDYQLGTEIQAEIAALTKIKEKLMSAPPKKPPPVSWRPNALTISSPVSEAVKRRKRPERDAQPKSPDVAN